MSTPDNVAPPALSSNAISSVLDFSTFQKTREALAGKTVIIGEKTYTFFVDVFPKDPGDGKLLDPREIAAALVSAINLDVDGSGVYYDSTAIKSANAAAEAYARGAFVTIVSRTNAAVIIGGDSGVTPTPPSGGLAARDSLTTLVCDATIAPLPSVPGATSFGLDNLTTDEELYVSTDENGVNYITIFPGTGRNFNGSPGSYYAWYQLTSRLAQLQARF